MHLLHIVATPRPSYSNTLRISERFLERLRAGAPDVQVQTRDLFTDDLPAVAGENIEAKYTLMLGRPVDPEHAESWARVESLIHQFLAADVYLISTPMWNFSIPYALKYYIDAIIQPGYLFRYDEHGVPVGLCHGKKMVCVTTRGGDYSAGPMQAYDLQEAYLRAIFGFVGITDIQFIHAQPMDVTPELREAAVSAGIEAAHDVAAKLTA